MLLIILIILLWSLRFAHSFQLGLNAAMAPLLFSNTWISHFPAAQVCKKVTPLGPLGFALALYPIVEQLSTTIPSLCLNLWYLNDGMLVGSATNLRQAVDLIELEGPSRGLSLNKSKCLLSLPPDLNLLVNPLPLEIPVTSGGFTLLGAPIGPSSHLSQTLSPS